MKQRIANITSVVLNPFVVSLTTILLLSFESTSTLFSALRWSGIMTGISVLPMFLVVLYQARTGRLDGILDATQQQRRVIYVLATTCAIIGYIVLRFWHAPLLLRISFTGGLAGTVVFMIINLRWKVSLVLLIGWARIELRRHSVGEVAAGAVFGSLVVVAVFQLYGLS